MRLIIVTISHVGRRALVNLYNRVLSPIMKRGLIIYRRKRLRRRKQPVGLILKLGTRLDIWLIRQLRRLTICNSRSY